MTFDARQPKAKATRQSLDFKNGAFKDSLANTNQNQGNWQNEGKRGAENVMVDLEQHSKIEKLIEQNFMKTPAE